MLGSGPKNKMPPESLLRSKCWRAMRMMRRFALCDLMAASGTGKSNVSEFIRGLVANGYVRLEASTRGGVKGEHAVYVLARDTGPFSPRVGKDGRLWDPNLEASAFMKRIHGSIPRSPRVKKPFQNGTVSQ